MAFILNVMLGSCFETHIQGSVTQDDISVCIHEVTLIHNVMSKVCFKAYLKLLEASHRSANKGLRVRTVILQPFVYTPRPYNTLSHR